MPRVFSPEMLNEGALDDVYDDEDGDPFEVAPAAFQYLSAPDLGGPKGVVRVAVRPEQVGQIRNEPTMYESMSGKQHTQDKWVVEANQTAAKLAEAMAALGAVRAYIRYDGGNDEGFAWFDHCIFKDGSTRDVEQITADLEQAGHKIVAPYPGTTFQSNQLDDTVATIWATALLGEGYGTGEYVMYGAFTVDLESGVVSDDPAPLPVTKNITLKAD